MRGKARTASGTSTAGRITPAYAGKSFTRAVTSAVHGDHPRLCGEKIWQIQVLDISTGSPPPMRGKVAMLAKLIGKKGITPAYAGKSCRPPTEIITIGDHPRLCGEKAYWTKSICPLPGSPPPMRGKGTAGSGGVSYERITPAYAGKRLHKKNIAFLC